MGKKQRAKKPKSQTTKRKSGTTPLPGAATLRFLPSGERCGLTSVSLSISSDKEAPSIVREIVQNSLDAATTAGRKLAYVRFSIENILLGDIPGVNEYREAVNAVADFYKHRDWPEQSKDIIEGLQKGLKRKELPVLIVTDNGIGLDKKTMMAILSDGVPEHGKSQSTGSHGNGHFTTFNLSEMRYVLYGGISEHDGKLASGHAILASHQNGKDLCGKDGCYISNVSNDMEGSHTFAEGEKIPELILKQLNKIKSEWGTGTALIIPDFNYFGEDEKSPKNAADMILGAAVQNFFIAIQRGGLTVSVKIDNSEPLLLNADNIQKVMQSTKGKIPRAKGFPNHDVADRFSQLFADCENKNNGTDIVNIDTECGEFEFRYRAGNVSDTNTKIALCRNGMWITSNIPLISPGDFLKNVPFEGLLLCDAERSGSLHDYVRKAEGNLHNALTLKLIQDKDTRTFLRGALKKTREYIQDIIEKQDSESMTFLEIDSSSIRVSPPKREKIKRINPPEPPNPPPNPPNPPRTPPHPKPKPGNPLGLQFAAARNGKNKVKIRIISRELAADVELRLSVNGGGDISCVNVSADNTYINIEEAECDGNICLVEKGCARLGKVERGDVKTIQVTYTEPPIKGDYRIDCEFLRRAGVS